MKRNLIILSILLFAMGIAAKERSLNEIRNIASNYLYRVSTSKAQQAKAKGNTTLRVLHADKNLTVMGTSEAGFVIVANDDAFQPVVGYSDGSFDMSNNESLAWFVSAVSSSMKSMLEDGRVRRLPVAPQAAPVAPLLVSTWSQSTPYNNMCPSTEGGNHYPCGCVATAMGQIMNYHKYPEHGSGEKQYSFRPATGEGQLLYANFGETYYDWDNILDQYTTGDYTDVQADAVALLLLQSGVAVEMQYTPSGSGAYSSEAKNGLIKYFLYNENLGIFYRDYYSLEVWMQMIYEELNKQRPIYYAGVDENRGGHAFVVDGYNAEGFVHINWGWGPDGGNGYYDITLLNPSGYSFSIGQNMIMGIAKPTETVEYQSHIVSPDDFIVSNATKIATNNYITGVSVGTRLYNVSGGAWTGSLAIIMKNGNKTYVLQERTVSSTADGYNVLSNISENFKAAIKIPEVANGTYHLFVASKDGRDDDWRLVRREERLVNSYLITITDGEVIKFESNVDDTWPITTAINAVTVTKPVVSDNNWYTIDGQRLNGEPTQRGIYIHNGHKVLK